MNVVMPARLTFDARGDSDLRPAATSHMALVRDRAEHEYNPGGQMQPDSSDFVLGLLSRGAQRTSLFVDTPGHFQVILNFHRLSPVQQHVTVLDKGMYSLCPGIDGHINARCLVSCVN